MLGEALASGITSDNVSMTEATRQSTLCRQRRMMMQPMVGTICGVQQPQPCFGNAPRRGQSRNYRTCQEGPRRACAARKLSPFNQQSEIRKPLFWKATFRPSRCQICWTRSWLQYAIQPFRQQRLMIRRKKLTASTDSPVANHSSGQFILV